MRSMLAALVVLLTAAPAFASGPFIEITVMSSSDSGSFRWLRYVFDTSAPPVSPGVFQAVVRETMSDSGGPFGGGTVAVGPDGFLSVFDIGGGSVRLGEIPGPDEFFAGGLSAFSVGMTALPADPAAYGPGTGASTPVAIWTDNSGFTLGTLHWAARIVDDPAGPACVADIDGNGVLNLDDLDAFVAAFLGGCG